MNQVHVYERDEAYSGGLVFAGAAPEEFFSHEMHTEGLWEYHGTLDEFTEMVENELGEWENEFVGFEEGAIAFTHSG